MKEKYDFTQVKKHLETISDTQEKIIYLMKRKAEFNQEYPFRFGFVSDLPDRTFELQCETEIGMYKEIAALKNGNQNDLSEPDPFDNTFIHLLKNAEGKFKPNENTPKIQLAAFVEIMFDKKWLANKNNRRKSCKDFARWRYNVDLGSAIDSGKKDGRNTYKKMISKHF